MKIIVTILLLLYTRCTSVLAIRSINSSHCTDVNCICLERELESALKDDTPPKTDYWKAGSGERYFSNAHKISRALFPPQKAPAKFIVVKVMLYNSSSQSTRTEHYIWSLSCIYAVLPRYVLTLVSLGTLYHEREELELTIPQFCQDVPSEKYMNYALFSLQDFSIIPSSSDSRLNTATCVVKLNDNNGSRNHLTGNVQTWLCFTIYSLQIFVSTIVGYLFCLLLIDYYDERDSNTDRLYAFQFTGMVIVLLEFLLCAGVVAAFVVGSDGLDGFSIFVLVCPISIYIISASLYFPYVWICEKRDSKSLGDFFLFLLSFTICYHLMWVLLGIFVNPVWASSVLLPMCSFFVLVYILAYYYSKTRVDGRTTRYFHLMTCVIVMLTFLSFVAFTCIFVKFFLANQLISSLIQTGLTTVLGVIFSFVSYLTPDRSSFRPLRRDEQNGTEMTRTTTTTAT